MRDRLIGFAIVIGCGVLVAAAKLRFILLVAMAVLPLLLKRGLLTPRFALGSAFVLAGIGAGSLPLVDPVDNKLTDFHSEELSIASVSVLQDGIRIRATAKNVSPILTVDNVPGRARVLQSLRPGDHVTAWFVPSNGSLWQLSRDGELLVSLADRNRERQAEAKAILVYPGFGLATLGALLMLV